MIERIDPPSFPPSPQKSGSGSEKNESISPPKGGIKTWLTRVAGPRALAVVLAVASFDFDGAGCCAKVGSVCAAARIGDRRDYYRTLTCLEQAGLLEWSRGGQGRGTHLLRLAPEVIQELQDPPAPAAHVEASVEPESDSATMEAPEASVISPEAPKQPDHTLTAAQWLGIPSVVRAGMLAKGEARELPDGGAVVLEILEPPAPKPAPEPLVLTSPSKPAPRPVLPPGWRQRRIPEQHRQEARQRRARVVAGEQLWLPLHALEIPLQQAYEMDAIAERDREGRVVGLLFPAEEWTRRAGGRLC